MFVRNGRKVGSILRDREVVEVGPTRSEPEAQNSRARTKAELQAEAESLGLPTDGTKADLQARIDGALAPEDEEEVTPDAEDDLHG